MPPQGSPAAYVVLVDLSKATSEDIAASINAMRAIHARYGSDVPRNIQLVRSLKSPVKANNAQNLRGYRAHLDAINRARKVQINGLGAVQAVQVVVDPRNP